MAAEADRMLARARQRATGADLDNVHFIHGDTSSEELSGLEVDCVVINMVLHHTPDPEQVLRDVAGSLHLVRYAFS